MRHFLPISLLILSSSLVSCEKKESDTDAAASAIVIAPSLLRIEAANFSGLRGRTSLTALGATKTTDVNILSLRYPIGSISLSDAPEGQTASASGSNSLSVYECAGSDNEACLVELTGDALTNLLASAEAREARVGTYSQVNISPCFAGGASADVRVKLTAEALIDGVQYYTNATTGLSTTAPAEEVTFSPNGGCGTVRFLTKDIVITKDNFVERTRPLEGEGVEEEVTTGELKDKIDLKLYFDLSNSVIAAGPSTATNAPMEAANSDFCRGQATRENAYVCLNFPEIVGTIDSGTPSLTRMLINDSTIWGFYSSSEGEAFGAYQRSYFNGFYEGGVEPEFLVGAMFERFQSNADGSISFKQYDDGQDRHIKVENFKLENHSGTLSRGASGTLDYTAVKLP